MGLAVLGTTVGLSAAVNADPITIQNPSFETVYDHNTVNPYDLPAGTYTNPLQNASVTDLDGDPFTGPPSGAVDVPGGWVGGGDSFGVYDDDDSEGQLYITGETGQNVGYTNGTSSMTQTLAATLQAGTYVLTADIGYPQGSFVSGSATALGDLRLQVGGVEIDVPVETGVMGVGTLAPFSRTYTISEAEAASGGALQVFVTQLDNGATPDVSLYFDNFSLQYTAVPEPTSIALVGLAGGAMALRRRRA